MKRTYPRKAEITRAVEAAKACGMEVAGIEISPAGTIKILSLEQTSASEFDEWDKAGRL